MWQQPAKNYLNQNSAFNNCQMKKIICMLLLLLQAAAFAQVADETYPVDSASVEHPGVPKGEVLKFSFSNSKIYPGTFRDYWVYIPAQYDPRTPACVYINQDGVQWKTPTVFDNLIYQKEMPITIGVFVSSGRVPAANAATSLERFNRSFEYDGLGDSYARFILDELLPDVENKKASDGREIRLSKNGNDRAIGGSSSGAVCAFTAAWERPADFTRVFSAVGTYVGMRGADQYPTLIRKYEPKPLRIFLQDGSADLNIYGGDWWKANELMERALTFAGYEVRHEWGAGGHNNKQGTAVFPAAMRWLWKGWPLPVTTGNSANQQLKDILLPGETWQLVGDGYKFADGIAANAAGEVFFQDLRTSKSYKVSSDGKLTVLAIDAKGASGTAFDVRGNRYVTAGTTKQLLAYDVQGKPKVIADRLAANDLVIAFNGNIYCSVPDGAEKPGSIYLIKPDRSKRAVDVGLKFPTGLALTPDQTQLYVAESASHWIWVFTIMPDGSLTNKQHYGRLHIPGDQDYAWPDGLKCDTAGRVFVATNLGIQINDQIGRVNAILPVPSGQASSCCLGGPGFNILYVTCGDKVYRRKLKVRGANSFEAPVKPAKPQL
jgi:gluconolactonase